MVDPHSTAHTGSLAGPASSCRCASSPGCSAVCFCKSSKLELVHLADPAAFAERLAQLRRTDWVVYAKPPFGGPEQVLAYLGRYTHRVAIANSRLISLADGKVSFSWKDYRQNRKAKVMTLNADEFIRRFLLHTLSNGFHRIRHYGFLANGGRNDKIVLCRQLLAVRNAPTDQEAGDDSLTKCEIPVCPHCGGTMRRVDVVPRACAPVTIRFVVTRHDQRPHYPPPRDHLRGGNVRSRRSCARRRTPGRSFDHASQRRKSLAGSRNWPDQSDPSHLLNVSPTRGEHRRAFSATAPDCTIAIAPTTPRLRSIRLL